MVFFSFGDAMVGMVFTSCGEIQHKCLLDLLKPSG